VGSFENLERSPSCAPLFNTVKIMHQFKNKNWATFWDDFSPAHLVTLCRIGRNFWAKFSTNLIKLL
jgi:hypothetical protein